MRSTPLRALVAVGVSTAACGLLLAHSSPRPRPSELYKSRCARCHGNDGRGRTPKGRQLRARDFTDPDFQRQKSDAELLDAIINGTDHDMPAFGTILSEAQIRSMLAEVRRFGATR
jgi:mono/diheme cytochrome c family protein